MKVGRWVGLGVAIGAFGVLLAFAPAAWLAAALQGATGSRLLLADARGTVWSGSATPVLTGGIGSRDAAALPGRLAWTIGLDGAALGVRARHDCCINGELRLRIVPGIGRLRIELPAPASPGSVIGQWPAAWLAGLGTPWNTLQPSGSMQLTSPGLALDRVQGRWRLEGRAELALNSMASRVSTLDVLGSYRLAVDGGQAGADVATLQLQTTSGALQLSGSGQFVASKLRFSGQASAAPGSETVLNNLLNIIGRRQGALSVISIG